MLDDLVQGQLSFSNPDPGSNEIRETAGKGEFNRAVPSLTKGETTGKRRGRHPDDGQRQEESGKRCPQAGGADRSQ